MAEAKTVTVAEVVAAVAVTGIRAVVVVAAVVIISMKRMITAAVAEITAAVHIGLTNGVKAK